MNTQEKLERIKARCQELLAISERRTPGKWKVPEYDKAEPTRHASATIRRGLGGIDIGMGLFGTFQITPITYGDVYNADFIASCAGAAEAGWRATIAAIDSLLRLNKETELYEGHGGQLKPDLNDILAAWPDEIL